MKTVAVLGATSKTDRFAWRAIQKLEEFGHKVFPVNPAFQQIDDHPCYPSVSAVSAPIHTLTMYVGAPRSELLIDEIIASKPRRIIFNPGSENPHLAERAKAADIEVVNDCTLIMLEEGTF